MTVMTGRKRVAIFISGRGSNMMSLINASKMPDYPAEIVLIISDNADADGLIFAKNNHIPALVITKKDYPQKSDYDNVLDNICKNHYVDIICLAGFMRLLSADFCDKWMRKMINIHPSLLPAFKGLDTHKRAIESGVKFSGCSVHYVTAGMDEGDIIAQAALKIMPDDTPNTLSKRILKLEHILYPKVLKKICNQHHQDVSFFEQDIL